MAPEPFYAIGQWYVDFSQTSDEEVVSLLRAAAGFGRHRAATTGPDAATQQPGATTNEPSATTTPPGTSSERPPSPEVSAGSRSGAGNDVRRTDETRFLEVHEREVQMTLDLVSLKGTLGLVPGATGLGAFRCTAAAAAVSGDETASWRGNCS